MNKTIEDFYSNISSNDCNKLATGTDKTIEQLFNSCIKPNLPLKQTVQDWNTLLMKYVNDKDAIFFVRKYGSASKKKWTNIRRGFLTKYADDFQYVYVDNFFAHYIFLMAINNFVPTYQEFKDFILSRKIPYGFMRTSAEKDHQAFEKGKVVPLNKNGWKLAHLFSVNAGYNFDYATSQVALFPLGDINEWKIQGGYTFPLKLSNEVLTPNQKEIIKAHFLRFIHPINYFLVPKKSCEEDDVNNDIGEYENLINYVYLYIMNEYPNELKNFEKVILAPCKNITQTQKELGDEVINIHYGLKLKSSQKNAPQKASSSKNINTVQIPTSKVTRAKSTLGQTTAYFKQWIDCTGTSNKAASYAKAIQYLADYIGIDMNSMPDVSELSLIENCRVELSDEKSALYTGLDAYLAANHRSSYLKKNFITAAIPSFIEFVQEESD